MLSDIALFLIHTLSTLLGAALLLRAWMHWVQLSPYHPIVQAIYQLTHWLVMPLRRVLPGVRRIDWASLIGAWLVAFFSVIFALALNGVNIVNVLWPCLIAALLIVMKWTVNMLIIATLLLALLSWLNPVSEVMGILVALTAPFLDPIRRWLPRAGAFDLSPLALFLLGEIALIVINWISARIFSLGALF